MKVAAPERPRRAWPWLLSLSLSALAVVVGAWCGPAVSLSPVAAYALAFAVVCMSALAAGATVPLRTWPELLPPALLGVLLLVWASTLSASALPAAALTLGLLMAGSALGGGLGARIDRPGHLLAVALVSSLADLWSVFDAAGPSAQLAAQIASEGPAVLSPFVLPWAMVGSDLIVPILGVGDVVFMALYAAAARSHGLRLPRMLAAMGVACLVALGAVIWSERPLPLLPLLGAAVIASEPAARRIEGRDRRVLLLACAGIVLAMLVRLR